MTLNFDKEFTDAKIFENEKMKKHTSFGVGGCARYFVKVYSLYALNTIINCCKKSGYPFKVIGNGTNLLVSDKGYDGVIICTTALSDIFQTPQGIKAMAGASLQKLIAFSQSNNFTGLEYLSGIPATVGGGVVMNASAFGQSVSDHIIYVETIKNGKLIRYDKDVCKFGYRKSRFKGKNEVVASALFDLKKGDGKKISSDIKSVLALRKKLQPIGNTCGSVFKNPKGVTAGQLIEGANLKGVTCGGASVSEKHANFIINNQGSATDIYNLINYVKQKVKLDFNIELQEEVEYIGEF